jgi:predicted MFS family arabinose efflux permease
MISVLGVFIGPILGSRIAKAKNARGVFTAGTIVRITVTVAIVFLLKPTTSILIVYGLMLVAGFYNSQHSVTFSTAPQIQIPEDIRVMGNSVVQLAMNIGGAFGLGAFSVIIAQKGVVDGMPIALIIATAAAAVALVIGLFLKPLGQESA